ncbi:MAG: PEP-CTERM sorting domain-containing protein [Planctomycetia bacterium]|nr:PEP-CTERM sorting domain-containing protein [Planctomycetia bacterium]
MTNGGNTWLNIGESSSSIANYTMTGGTIDGINNFVVGRRGEGHFTMGTQGVATSETSPTVTASTLMLGYAPTKASGSTITLYEGTFNVTGVSYIGGDSTDDVTDGGGNTYKYAFTLDGATYNATGDVLVGHFSSMNNMNLETEFNMDSGTWNLTNRLLVASGDNSSAEGKSNKATVTISGGETKFNSVVRVGDAEGSHGILNIEGGTVNFVREDIYIGLSNNAIGELNISGGTLSFSDNKTLNIGFYGGSTGYMNIKTGADVTFKTVRAGAHANTTGTIAVSGGNATFTKWIGFGSANNAVGNLNISGGTTTFKEGVDFGTEANGVGNLNVSGGTVTFEKVTRFGTNTGATGNMTVSGGEAVFSKAIQLGTGGGTGIMTLTGGKTSVNSETIDIGVSGTGKLNVSGNAELTFTGNDIHVGRGGDGSVVQSGGTVTVNGWLNIGENTAGTYTLSGGTLDPNGDLVVGRRNSGTLTVSGTGNLEAGSIIVGYFPEKSGDSNFNIQGGTVTGSSLTVGANSSEGAGGAGMGTSAVNISGGTVTLSGAVKIGEGKNSTGVMTISNGTVTSNEVVRVGLGDNASGTLNISGGTFNLHNWLSVGFHANTKLAEVNISGGNTTVNWMALADVANSEATLNISGGTFRLNAQSTVGNATGSVATVNLTGGTLYGPNADFIIGESNATARFTVDGGTYTDENKGSANFVIRSTTATNENGEKVGSLIELKSGTLTTKWFSMGQGGSADGTCTFNMTGGTLNVGDGNFRVGHQYNGTANVSGGTLNIQKLYIAGERAGGTLNIIGADSQWNVTMMETKETGKLNFIAGKFGVNPDGTAKAAVSTINVSGEAWIGTTALKGSAINIDMSDYFYDGAAYVTGDLTQTLISAGTLSNYNPEAITVSEGWNLEQNGNLVVLTFDETQFALADVTSGSGIASGNLGTESWVTLTGNANDTVSLSMMYTGDGDVEDFVFWLQESMDETQSGVNVKLNGDTIAFENLVLDENGVGYLNFGLDAYNALNGTNMSFKNVPEPSTWGLMLVGLGVGFFFRKRKELKK